MKIKVSIDDAITKKLEATRKQIDIAVDESIAEIAANFEADVKMMHQKGGSRASGRVYTRGSISHKASAPGMPPAPDRGTLLNSVYNEPMKNGSNGYVVGSRLKYSYWLEYGTRKMRPRPMWRVVYRYWVKNAPKLVAQKLKEAMK